MFQVKDFTFSAIEENTYLLYNEKGNCIILDPGCYDDVEKDELSDFISKNNLHPKMLLNTHCHLDHVFGNKYVAETYGLGLQIHPLEEAVLQFAPAAGLMYQLPFDNYQGPLQFLNEGDIVKLDEDELLVLHVPGHSPGSICFYCATQNFIIGGDVLFHRSIGRTDLPGGSFDDLINGIRSKIFTLPDDTIIYPGHGIPTTVGEEKKYNPFLT